MSEQSNKGGAAVAAKPKYLFRVRLGFHSQGHYPPGHLRAGKPVMYFPGDIVASDVNLAKKFNKGGSAGAKFERVYNLPVTDRIGPPKKEDAEEDDVDQGPTSSDGMPHEQLETFTIEELRKMASDDGIDLEGTKGKAQIIERIKSAYSDTAPATKTRTTLDE